MLNPSILIWEDCDPTVAEAVKKLQQRWRPSSTGNSGHTVRLTTELIDSAISTYAATLPQRYLSYLPGVGTEDSFSGIIQKFGLNTMARVQRTLLSAFRSTQHKQSPEDIRLTATLETLIGLVDAYNRKRSISTKIQDTPLDNSRAQGFCRFCGALAELTSFAEGCDEIELYPTTKTPVEKQKTRRLSSQYCVDHRAKLPNGEWNPEYRKAKRSEADFNLELRRLSLQSVNLSTTCAQSGDPLLDSYIYYYVRMHNFQPADEAELRHHARLMVDAKLSDRKKKIVLLQRYSLSQSEIARKLDIPRQHVSRDLAAIPDIFRQLPALIGVPSYFH